MCTRNPISMFLTFHLFIFFFLPSSFLLYISQMEQPSFSEHVAHTAHVLGGWKSFVCLIIFLYGFYYAVEWFIANGRRKRALATKRNNQCQHTFFPALSDGGVTITHIFYLFILYLKLLLRLVRYDFHIGKLINKTQQSRKL